MIDLRTLKVAKALGARRETQRHLDCLTRQIAARAGRQATTGMVRRRARHRSYPRIYNQELVDCLTVEHWAELDIIARRIEMDEQVIGDCQRRDHELVHHPAIQADPKRRRWFWACLAWLRCHRHGGLGHGTFSLLGIGIGPVPDCPSCAAV